MPDRAALETALDAIRRGRVDELVDYVDPAFEGVVPADMSAEPDTYAGPEGVRRYFELFEETVEDLRFEPQLAEDIDDWILVEIHITGRGRSSGLPVDAVVVSAVLMRGQKLLRMEGFRTLDEARAALAERAERR